MKPIYLEKGILLILSFEHYIKIKSTFDLIIHKELKIIKQDYKKFLESNNLLLDQNENNLEDESDNSEFYIKNKEKELYSSDESNKFSYSSDNEINIIYNSNIEDSGDNGEDGDKDNNYGNKKKPNEKLNDIKSNKYKEKEKNNRHKRNNKSKKNNLQCDKYSIWNKIDLLKEDNIKITESLSNKSKIEKEENFDIFILNKNYEINDIHKSISFFDISNNKELKDNGFKYNELEEKDNNIKNMFITKKNYY